MKPTVFLPLLAAAIGFAVAWTVKPTAKPTGDSGSAAAGMERNQPVTRTSTRASGHATSGSRKPKEVHATDFPLADAAEHGPQTALEGKLGRLTEALGLSVDQQAAIVAALEAARAAASDKIPVLEDMAARGSEIEAKLKELLSPEQFAKFQEIRERERDNLVESRAQSLLSPVLERIDLSPEQRQDLLARLRLYQREEIQQVPAAATLLLGNSLLPTDPRDPNIDGVLTLVKMETSGVSPAATAQEAHDRVIQKQKEALERKLECFDGILTSGQMGQYQAYLAEQRRVLDEMQRRAAESSARKAQAEIEKEAESGDPEDDEE